MGQKETIKNLLSENTELKNQLYEAQSLIEAIREGAIDALVVNNNGKPDVYSLQTADYTYRILIEKIGEGALSISETGIILYCNEYFSKLVNIPSGKIIGTSFSYYVENPEQLKTLSTGVSSGISKGEIILNGADSKVPVYVSLTSLQPNVPAIGVIVTDLSEKRVRQKELEQKIIELNATKDRLEQFIHVVSHDIKEPIRKIIVYGSHLITTTNDSKENINRDSLSIINNSAKRLNSLVDDLAKYSLAMRNGEAVDVDLNKIVNEVLDDWELLIKEKSAIILFENLPVIQGSETQMRELFSNLFSNALKFKRSGETPLIKVSSEIVTGIDVHSPDKKYYKIKVSDNGIGMKEEYLKKIFIMFQRLNKREEYPGNGIGLAVCARIMENHSGKISAESIPGEGTSFNLFFPVNN